MCKALAHCWIQDGHDVTILSKIMNDNGFIQNKNIYDKDKCLVKNIGEIKKGTDFYWDLFDFFKVLHNSYDPKIMMNLKINTGFFCWALSPLPEKYIRKVNEIKKPLIMNGLRSYEETKNYGLNVHYVPDGVDHSIFNIDKRKNNNNDIVNFLWVGHNSIASCPDLVFMAFDVIRKNYKNTYLTVVDPWGRVESLASEILNEDLERINFKRGLNHIEISYLYSTHDALVLPVRFHCTCRPILEAMASGIPIITNLWTGPSIFLDKELCLAIDYDLVKAIYESICLENKFKNIAGISFCKCFQEEEWVMAKPKVDSVIHNMLKIINKDKDIDLIVQESNKKSKQFTWEKTAKNIIEIVEDYL